MKIFSSRIAQYMHFFLLLIQVFGHLNQEASAEPLKVETLSSDLVSFPDQKSQLKRISLNTKRSTQKASNQLNKQNHSPDKPSSLNKNKPQFRPLRTLEDLQLDDDELLGLFLKSQMRWTCIY